MKYLLDTMVVSEPTKVRPSSSVMTWLGSARSDEVAVSAITVGELVYGVERLPRGRRRDALHAWLEVEFMPAFEPCILPLDGRVAREWALLRAATARTRPLVDMILAATAATHGLTIVTRNVSDFAGLPVPVFNPFA